MAGQNNNTGLVITLSCFVLLSVILGVFMYMTGTHNAKLAQDLSDKTSEATGLSENVRDLTGELETLKSRVGVPGEKDEVIAGINAAITRIAADGASTQLDLEGALVKTGVDRDVHNYSSNDRMAQLTQKTTQLQQTIQTKDAEIKSFQDAALKSEETLRQKEAQHSEELASRERQISDIRTERDTLQAEYSTFKTRKNREVEDLQDDIAGLRGAVVALRQKLFEQEDLSFDVADGSLTFVDQTNKNCSIDLGERDGLQVGTTFSVYTKSNNGVGRRNTEDVKGKIEVVAIKGPHRAECRIVQQDLSRPLSANDPIYSPLFASGQSLEIAVAGLLDFDGNPGGDDLEFRRMVNGAGAVITIRTNSRGEILDQQDNILNSEDIRKRITEKTRFLVIGDTGEGVDITASQDNAKVAIYRKIQQDTADMKKAAEASGVYVISLSSFLEYIGYTKKRLAWDPTTPFPAKLSNGGKSTSVNSGLGERQSSGAISGAFSQRKKTNATSTGSTSGLFKQ